MYLNKFDQETVGKQIMWLNKKESSKGQRYFKIPEILMNVKVASIHQRLGFLVWGSSVQGNLFFNTKKYKYKEKL